MNSDDRLFIDAIRVLSMDAVQRANSGHPGTPMALAPVGYALFARHLRHNPADPHWPERDRFVLSVGHASMLLYSLLHLSGYEVSLEDLRQFRQLGSKTPGHPEVGHTPGVETTTGPLGAGVSNSVGMALAERWLAARFNRPGHDIVDHHTVALCSDGDLMEGISQEVAAFAGHQKLGKLIWVFDDNRITIEGNTDLATSTDHGARFEACGWHVVRVDDGNDLEAIDAAMQAARAETGRPSLVILRTTIAWGSPGKAGTPESHGAPLGADEVEATKRNLGYPSLEPFHMPAEIDAMREAIVERGAALQQQWAERFAAYSDAHPELAAEYRRTVMRRELPAGWSEDLPPLDAAADATRNSSGKVLNTLAERVPELIGGSADLGGSNKTDIVGGGDLLPDNPSGRVIHFGIREHGMGGILNGMALHGGVRPFGGTFLIFSDYMRPAIRLASLTGAPSIFVFTHDSIGLGEDGPTHQPIEQLMSLRMIPGLMDLRPADPTETVEAWSLALGRRDGPSFLALTRQKVPVLDRSVYGSAEGVRRGAYVLAEASGSGDPDVVLLASGSEVATALEAWERLQGEGVSTRVVSMPSWHLFGLQGDEYRAEVLAPGARVHVSVEAGTTLGWERWTGPRGRSIGIDSFGASAPAPELFEHFGITADAVVEAARCAL